MDMVLWSASTIVRFWRVIEGRGGAGILGVDMVCFVGVGEGWGFLGGLTGLGERSWRSWAERTGKYCRKSRDGMVRLMVPEAGCAGHPDWFLGQGGARAGKTPGHLRNPASQGQEG